MVEFIELSDSDSSCDHLHELAENGQKENTIYKPTDGSHMRKPLQDGKPVTYSETFHCSNDTLGFNLNIHKNHDNLHHRKNVSHLNNKKNDVCSCSIESIFFDNDDDQDSYDNSNLNPAVSPQEDRDTTELNQDQCSEEEGDQIALNGEDIILKHGNRNFGADPSVSFSYATSKLFNNIAKSSPNSSNATSTANMHQIHSDNRNPYTRLKSAGDNSSGKEGKNKLSTTWQTTDDSTIDITLEDNCGIGRQHSSTNNGSSNNAFVSLNDKLQVVVCEKMGHVDSTEDRSQGFVAFDIDPEWYKPIPSDRKPSPVVHYVTRQTRPVEMRKLIPVDHLFGKPFVNFWTSKFHSFNEMQSELAIHVVNSDKSLVVSAPTAAGKTCIFEMAICRLLAQQLELIGRNQKEHGMVTSEIPKSKKILYIAPNKALCEERYDDWSRRFSSIHSSIEIALVTGDSDAQSFIHIASAHLILTTPEKWDSITRRWTERFFLISSIKLLLVDEVHMLGDEQRGPCLESLICRMKTVQLAAKAYSAARIGKVRAESPCSYTDLLSKTSRVSENGPISDIFGNDTETATKSKMRIVAVSATLPNISDIAAFLDVQEAFSFDESYRPVTLQVHVVGLGYKGTNPYLFDKNLDRHVPELLDRFSEGKPAIVFCHSKKETERLAADLASRSGSSDHPRLFEISMKTNSSMLQRCLRQGVAFHHAGMEAENRRLVEHTFSNGLLRCLCATSTLAVGVNMPAHLVIIKGTSAYRGASIGHVEIDVGTILQMIGRAGRPGFDTSGTAVIMTDIKSKSRYEKLSSGLETVESFLLSQLTETLNTEVSQRVITTIQGALDWLKGTFFFHCIRRNPGHYGLSKENEEDREEYLMKRCLESLQALHNSKIIRIQDDMIHMTAESASHVMNHHIVPFEAMKLISSLPYDSGPFQLLQFLSKMKGLHFPVRKAEKTLLNEAHKEMKYKLEGPLSKVRIQTSEEKAFVLLQAAIGQYYFEDYTLRQEMSVAVEYAKRMLLAVEEFSVTCSKHGTVALESLLLRRSLNKSLWSPNDGVLNQIKGVGQKCGKKLADNHIKSFADVLSRSSNDIEQACGRSSPFGQELRAAVTQIFRNSLRLSAYIDNEQNDQPSLTCTLKRREDIDMSSTQTREMQFSVQSHRNHHEGTLLKANLDSSLSLDHGIVSYTLSVHIDGPASLLMFRHDVCDEGVHSISCPNSFGRLYIRLVCNIIGMDEQLTIDGGGTISRSMFSVSPKAVAGKGINRMTDKSHRGEMEKLVGGIEDVRVHKRKIYDNLKKVTATEEKDVSTPSLSSIYKRRIQQNFSEVVTPSPIIQLASASAGEKKPGMPMVGNKNMNRPDKLFHEKMSSWEDEKLEQTSLQQRVFKSDRDNPFSSYKCDPNNLELQMELQSTNGGMDRYGSGLKIRAVGGCFSRIPRLNPLSSALRRKRFRKSTFRMPNQDLLRMKAQEQQAYAAAHKAHISQPSFYRPRGSHMPSYTMIQHAQNHDLYHSVSSLDNPTNFTRQQYDAVVPSLQSSFVNPPNANSYLFAEEPWIPQTHGYTIDDSSYLHMPGYTSYTHDLNPYDSDGSRKLMHAYVGCRDAMEHILNDRQSNYNMQLNSEYNGGLHQQANVALTQHGDPALSNCHWQPHNHPRVQPMYSHESGQPWVNLEDCTRSAASNNHLLKCNDMQYYFDDVANDDPTNENSIPKFIETPKYRERISFHYDQRFEDAFL